MDRADLEQWKGREVARLLALVETERRYYQEIVASLPIGLAVLSSDGSILSANRAFRHIFSLRTEDLRRRTIDQLVPSPGLQARIADAVATGALQPHVLIEVSDEHGGARRLRAAVMAVRNWDEETELEALLMIEDAGETIPVLAAPQPAAGPGARMVPLPEMPAILWAANPATLEFTFIEGDTHEVFGYAPEHWMTAAGFWSARIHAEDREEAMRFYRGAIAAGGRHACEYRLMTASGSVAWCRDSFRVALDESGEPVRMTGVLTDVTERRNAEQQAIQAQRMDALATLAKTLTHDLNNSLMIVTGYGEELLGHLSESDPAHDDMAEILGAGERMAVLANDLLIFTRRQGAAPGRMDAADAVREVASRAAIETNGCAAPVWAMAEREELERMLAALVGRLHRASSTASRIRMTCGWRSINEWIGGPEEVLPPGMYAEIVLSIDAEIPAEPPLFEGLLPGKDPSGPELARAYAIAREWGGCVWQTETPERTGELHVFLRAAEPTEIEPPAAEQPPPVPEPEPEPEPAAEPPELETVLVVEDEGGIRALVRKILRRQGYRVLEAGTPDEAVETAQSSGKPIHLLVTDMNLPQRSGRALARDLHELFPEMKVLYVSGYTDDSTVYAGELPAGAAFLQKPFTLGSLLKKVRDVLDEEA
jgi:PAS domain S-box-containing protein